MDTEYLIAELSAAAAIIGYWDTTTPAMSAIWVSVGVIVAVGINALGVGKHFLYGCSLLLTLHYRCIRRGGVLVQVNTGIKLKFVPPLTDFSLAQ